MKTIITRRAAMALAIALALGACGGSEPPEVAAATQQYSAPAGSLTIAAGERAGAQRVAIITEHTGPRLTRVSLEAKASGVRLVGAGATGALRWAIRADGRTVARGTLSAASTVPVSGAASYALDVEGGQFIEMEITAEVASPGAAAVAWDSVSLSASIAIK